MSRNGLLMTEYSLKPKPLTGIVLTEENFDMVAIFCGGEVFNKKDDDQVGEAAHIAIPHIKRPFYLYIGDFLYKDKDGRFVRIGKSVFEDEYQRSSPIVKFTERTPFVHESGLPGMPGSFPGESPELYRERRDEILRTTQQLVKQINVK